jgi:hypothetical protein
MREERGKEEEQEKKRRTRSIRGKEPRHIGLGFGGEFE